MSLSEIAEAYNVSRNAVYSQLTLTKEALNDYEKKLKLFSKNEKREEIVNKIKTKVDDSVSLLLDDLLEV